MQARIWLSLLSLAVIAGCAAPPPAEEASPAGEPTAATEPTAKAQQEGALADEGFESGRTRTLEKVEAPAAAEPTEVP